MKKLLIQWLAGDQIESLSKQVTDLEIKNKSLKDFSIRKQEQVKELQENLNELKLSHLKFQELDEWTEEDRKKLLSFLSKGAGAKFSVILRNFVSLMNAQAVSHPEHSVFMCGTAQGFKSAVMKIDELAQQPIKTEVEVKKTEADEQLEALGYFHARTNGQFDESLDNYRP